MCVCVCVSMCVFFSTRDIEVSLVKPVKFNRDSGYLARDEFLVISKRDHILIYV